MRSCSDKLTLAGVCLCVWILPACAETKETSENNPRLRRLLRAQPKADADGDGLLTRTEARRFLQEQRASGPARRQRRQKLPAPDEADVHYEPHRLQVFDLWLAKSGRPTPLVLYIHGGGFRGGDKRGLSAAFLKECLEGGYSVAAINYRLIPEVQFPAPMMDCAKAIQFLRHHAKKWNLDPKLIASTGGSAGAGISLWLAFHDDLRDPTCDDHPVAKESTRLVCVAVKGAQSSYDPRFARKIGLVGFAKHPSLLPFYGLKPEEVDTPKAHQLYEMASPINHLTRDDPPALLDYGVPNEPVTDKTPMGAIVHHPKFGIVLKEKMDALGIECVVQYPGSSGPRISSFAFIRKHVEQARMMRD